MRIQRIELCDGRCDRPSGLATASRPVPGEIDAVEKVLLSRLAVDYRKHLPRRSTAFRRAHPLAAMHAAADAGDLRVRLSQHGIVIAHIHFDAVFHTLRFLLLLLRETDNV